MKLFQGLGAVLLILVLCSGSVMAQDNGEKDTLWFESDTWLIESEADSISPPIEMWAYSQWTTDTMAAVAVGFTIDFVLNSFDPDRWNYGTEVEHYWNVAANPDRIDPFERITSSIDSLVTVHSFQFNPEIDPTITKTFARTKGFTYVGTDTVFYDYLGFTIGLVWFPFGAPPPFPNGVPRKVGDLRLKMNLSGEHFMPVDFDLSIDSAWFPPAGVFKFKEYFAVSGYPPQFKKGIVHVTCTDPTLDADDDNPTATLPTQYELDQNYPNPFNPSTTLRYSLKKGGFVELSIYNILGRKVKTLVSGEQDAGSHDVFWDGRNDSGDPVASGLYFYRLTAGDYVNTKKMLLVK